MPVIACHGTDDARVLRTGRRSSRAVDGSAAGLRSRDLERRGDGHEARGDAPGALRRDRSGRGINAVRPTAHRSAGAGDRVPRHRRQARALRRLAPVRGRPRRRPCSTSRLRRTRCWSSSRWSRANGVRWKSSPRLGAGPVGDVPPVRATGRRATGGFSVVETDNLEQILADAGGVRTVVRVSDVPGDRHGRCRRGLHRCDRVPRARSRSRLRRTRGCRSGPGRSCRRS